MNTGRTSTIAIIAASAWLSLSAQDARLAPPPQQPTFRAGADLIRLDVSVFDKNQQPVRGLTAADFTVVESGKPQQIISVAEIDRAELDPAPSARMKQALRDVTANDIGDQIGDGRLMAIVMDDRSVPDDAVDINMSTRQTARRIVDTMAPSDRAAVVYTLEAGFTEDFTGDHDKLLTAIGKFNMRKHEWRPPPSTDRGADLGNARAGVSISPPDCLERSSIGTLRTVVARLATAAPGRRKLLWFLSTGVAFQFTPLGSGCQPVLYQAMLDLFWQARRGNVNIHAIDPSGYDGYDAYLRSSRIRNGVLIPAGRGVNPSMPLGGRGGPGGFVAGRPGKTNIEFMQIIAENTGGVTVVHDDAIDAAVDRVFDQDSTYYLVGYQTSNGRPDGSFRKLSVKVNRSGLTVRTRSGYWALQNGTASSILAREAPKTADLNHSGLWTPPGLPLRATVVPIAKLDGAAGADVAVCLTVRVPTPTSPTSETATVVRNVYDGSARPSPPVREVSTIALDVTRTETQQYDVWSRLTLQPGRYELRLNVHSTSTDQNGTVYATVEVPDLSRAPISLTGLVLGRAPQAGTPRPDPFGGAVPITPTTEREFTRNDQLSVFSRIAQGGADAQVPVTVETDLLDTSDVSAFHSSVTLPSSAFATNRTAPFMIDLPLSQLRSGPYLLVLDAKLPSGVSDRREILIRVR